MPEASLAPFRNADCGSPAGRALAQPLSRQRTRRWKLKAETEKASTVLTGRLSPYSLSCALSSLRSSWSFFFRLFGPFFGSPYFYGLTLDVLPLPLSLNQKTTIK